MSDWRGHPRGSAPYRRLLAGLFFGGIATFAQLYSPQGVLPLVARDLRVDAAASALLISASTVGLAIGVIPWSIVADRIGRVRAMSFAVAAATVFGLVVPFLPTLPLLLSGRLLEGLMVGGVPAIAIAYLNEEVHSSSTARAAGTYVAGTTIGGLLGRIIAGPLGAVAGWRVGVFTVAVLCAVAAMLFIRLVPHPLGFVPQRDRRDAPGGADAPSSVRHRLAMNLRSPRQLVLYAQAFLLMGGFVALYNYLGFRLIAHPFDLPPSVVSLIFIAYLAGTWSAAQAGALASRLGRLPVLVGSALTMLAGVLLTLSSGLIPVLLGLVIATAGFFGAHAVASGWTGSDARVGRAQASSLYNLFYYAGSSLFGWLGGLFFTDVGWPGNAGMIIALAVIAVVSAAAVLRTRLSSSRRM